MGEQAGGWVDGQLGAYMVGSNIIITIIIVIVITVFIITYFFWGGGCCVHIPGRTCTTITSVRTMGIQIVGRPKSHRNHKDAGDKALFFAWQLISSNSFCLSVLVMQRTHESSAYFHPGGEHCCENFPGAFSSTSKGGEDKLPEPFLPPTAN